MGRIQAVGSRGHHQFTLDVNQMSQDVNNNTTNVNIFFYMNDITPRKYSFNYRNAIQWTINVNGKVWSGVNNQYGGTGQLMILAANIDIPHNADGTKSYGFSFNVVDGAGQSYTPGNASASGTSSFSTIPRASTISLNKNTIECDGSNYFDITVNRASSSFTHTLRYLFGTASGTIASNVGTSARWIPPTSLLSQFDSEKSGRGSIYCDTYSGGSKIGTSEVYFYLNAGNASAPTISNVNISELNYQVSNKTSGTVALLSRKRITCRVSAKYGATIQSVTVSNGGSSVELRNSGYEYTGEITNVTTGDYTITATDSRGNIKNDSVSQQFIDYKRPSIDRLEFERDNATGSNGYLNASGTYAAVLGNDINVYITRTGHGQTTAYPNKGSGSWNLSNRYSDLYYSESYSAKLEVVDTFGEKASVTAFLGMSTPTFFIGRNNVYINGKSILDLVHPIGSIYLSTSSDSPSNLLGGSWTQIAQGRTLIGAGSCSDSNGDRMNFYGGDTGGEFKHYLSVPEMPVHSHGIGNGNKFIANGMGNSQAEISLGGNSYALHNQTSATGGNQAHNNVQPYLVVYIWQRTA